MKIHVLSDVHLECSPLPVIRVDTDVVILAGDIGVGTQGVQWAKETFDIPVIYVPGNHEYHDSAFTMADHIKMMKQVADGSNVTILDNEVIEHAGVRFIGSTMWADLTKVGAVLHCDYDNISVKHTEGLVPEYFSIEVQQRLFERNREWLKRELVKPFTGKTVVITHHAPSWKSLHGQYVGNPWNPCFISNLENLMNGVYVWVHGHTHSNFDYIVEENTRVVCNPRGYPSYWGGWENPEFNSAKIIKVK